MSFADLRSIVPQRPLDISEALRVAELQANRLLASHEIYGPPVPEQILSTFPRIQVVRATLEGVAVTSRWAKGRWIIVLNRTDARTRQRFSLAHEFKHVLDEPFQDVLYPRAFGAAARRLSEQAADHFAAALLMPSQWLLEAYDAGGDSQVRRAREFDVSAQALQVRLAVLGVQAEAAG